MFHDGMHLQPALHQNMACGVRRTSQPIQPVSRNVGSGWLVQTCLAVDWVAGSTGLLTLNGVTGRLARIGGPGGFTAKL